MKVAVVGANGQLGADVVDVYRARGDELLALTHADIELADRASVDAALAPFRPDVVVNTAAAHNVERCEADPAQAFAVNAFGARNLAAACAALDCALVHVSTDYVFDGAKRAPYVETDAPRPLNVYGNSKLSGEHFVREQAPRHFVVRTSGLYGERPSRAKAGGLNFVRLMLKLAREKGEVKVVVDEFVSPTNTLDLARQIAALADGEAYGLYHATSQGQCSWYEFARAIFDAAGLSPTMHEARTGDFANKVPRPLYSVLDNAALRTVGLDRMPTWRDAVRRFVESDAAR